jgi:hypothetical protein
MGTERLARACLEQDGETISLIPPHLQALEEVEREGILGLVKVLREEGIDSVRYAL